MLLALMTAFSAGAQTPVESRHDLLIQRCSEQADREAWGMEQLEGQCPGLGAALSNGGYDAFISDDQRALMTVHKLVDLRRLVERYREPPSTRGLDPAALESVLTTLEQQPPSEHPLGWLGRLKTWFRDLVLDANEESSWLRRWLNDFEMSTSTSTLIYFSAIGLVILIAIAVLVNELRVAGVLRGRRSRRGAHSSELTELVRDPKRMTLSDLESLPLSEQPSMLLQMMAAQLMRAGRLKSERHLTHRELARAASFAVDEERTSFGRVAGVAEKLRYGGMPVTSSEVESVVREGRALSARLAAESAA